jgi:hypothetical protein
MTQIDFQGTWQFMSAKLIGLISGSHTHSLQDDLESSIYVLIWMTLMYSETSDASQVPSFLSGVLDPKPFGPIGGYGKADFLKARTFLQQVTFPGRQALHDLIAELAKLFAVRYDDKPTEEEIKSATFLKEGMTAYPDISGYETAYKATHVYSYETRMDALKGYNGTIALYDRFLENRNSWPADDAAVKQDFQTGPPRPQQVTKSGWDTALFVCDNFGEEEASNEPPVIFQGDLTWMSINTNEVSNRPPTPPYSN